MNERGGTDRRTLLKAALGLPVLGLARPLVGAARRSHVVVVGAGAFGGWTALELLRRGARVTLLDAWGPGNSRSSSGGETRVIRGIYGPDQIYVDWVVRSFAIWRESQSAWGERLYHPTGALWMFATDDAYVRSSLPLMSEAGLPVEELTLSEARRRFPQVSFRGTQTIFFEPEAGYLTARRACAAVARAVASKGGALRRVAVRPGPIRQGEMTGVELSDGGRIAADGYVFACGAWLAKLFPDLLGSGLRPTRQEVFFFGLPAGDNRFAGGSFPVWIDFGERVFYGVPGNQQRGFKVADNTRGAPIDPDTADRTPTLEHVARARGLLRRRFPALVGAPLLETRVCPYENSPDGHLILDRHPTAENVWIAGGGSGHGFKLGPAVGEHVAGLVLGDATPLEKFSLARLAGQETKPLSSQISGETDS